MTQVSCANLDCINYKHVQYCDLFDVNKGCGNGTPLYLLNEKGYPLLN